MSRIAPSRKILFCSLLPCAFVACSVLFSASLGAAADKCPDKRGAQEVLFQVSTLDALRLGIYQGAFTVGELKRHGNFGLGTYEGLDGEMVVLDGHYYHFKSDGTVSESKDDDKTPFAAVTVFKPDFRRTVNLVSMSQLGDILDAILPSKNFFYAVKVHGQFNSVSTRAVPKQSLPYPPLADAILQQSVFNYSNIVGTAVGIRSPAFVKGINQVAYHFHFVSDDKKAAGHALSFTTGQVMVEVQILRQNLIWLPDNQVFRTAMLPIQ
jgi:acetolactate decarboxylase